MSFVTQIIAYSSPYISALTPVITGAAQHAAQYLSNNPQRLQGLAVAIFGLFSSYTSDSSKALVEYEGPNCKALMTHMHSQFPEFMHRVDMENHTDLACRVSNISRFCAEGQRARDSFKSVFFKMNQESHKLWNSGDPELIEQLSRNQVEKYNLTTTDLDGYAFSMGKLMEGYKSIVKEMHTCSKNLNEKKMEKERCENRWDSENKEKSALTSSEKEQSNKLSMCKDKIAKEKDKCTAEQKLKDEEHKKEQKSMQKTIDELKEENAKLQVEITRLQNKGWFG